VSLAGLVGRPVRNPVGAEVGHLVDVVARWDDGSSYPPITGFVVRIGRRRLFVHAEQVQRVAPDEVTLASAKVDVIDFERRTGEVLLAADVLDHQLVDIDGVRVVRASDLYLAMVLGRLRLVGVDVGWSSLLRRMGPARWRTRPTPDRVIDWSTMHSFGGPRGGAMQSATRGVRRLRPAELADVLEDLGRTERHELLDSVDPDVAADALEEMDAKELGSLLRESTTEQAAGLLAHMEPDEAADALRDLSADERDELLEAMPDDAATEVASLLEHRPGTAGAIMTPSLVTVDANDSVAAIRDRMRANADHDVDLDGVIVVDDDGRLIDDVTVLELFLAETDVAVGTLIGPPWPMTVTTADALDIVIDRLLDSRRTSVVVLDEDNRPVGRIMADDAVDALVSDRGRFRFPRLLS
jgi:CBS domain-containing protein